MIRPLGRRDVLLGGVLACAGAWAGWTALSIDRARQALPEDPARALSWRAGDPEALRLLADDRIETGDLDGATALATRAFIGDPLSYRALALLARLAEWSGDPARADALLRLAAARTRQDVALQAGFIQLQLRTGDLAGALDSLDGVMRSNRPIQPAFLTTLAELAADPGFRARLVARLGTEPPWRTEFFRFLMAQPESRVLLERLFQEMSAAGTPPAKRDIQFYVQQLVAKQDYARAIKVWRSRPDAAAEAPLLVNGDFEHEPVDKPFDWQLQSSSNAEIRIVPSSDPVSGQALRISFAGGRLRVQPVSQLLALAPGSYELSWRARAQDLETMFGLLWEVRCVWPKDTRLARSPPLKGTRPWSEFSLSVTVPQTDCPAQTLQLRIEAPASLDQEIQGQIWFDDLSIRSTGTP